MTSGSEGQSSMINETYRFAYDLADARLKEQLQTIADLRTRSAGLLAAAAIGTSFTAGLGLFGADQSSPEYLLPTWATWVLAAVVLSVGGCAMFVLFPVKRWAFGINALDVLDEESRRDANKILRMATVSASRAADRNQPLIERRFNAYRAGVALLVGEVAVLMIAIGVGRP
ncbi:hypothetical protein GIS00_08010 [Nakamurella sp. YIM 132087]|uniref:Uncharacterized protein n=1 Tax=Nakamurella alba TaxID=2665158 RepID=A0A7K1FID3_9ACTN|nr:hypothetical protein [Nakamurella alba]MTD13885.1 hypothetical protein [Nakamurella alba]